MKNICFYLSLLLLLSCQQPKEIVIQLDSNCPLSEQEVAYKVISERLKVCYKIKTIEPLVNSQFKVLYYPEKDSHISPLLFTKKGAIYISESYETDDLFESLIDINQILREDTTLYSPSPKNNPEAHDTKDQLDSLWSELNKKKDQEESFQSDWEQEYPFFNLLTINQRPNQLIPGPNLGHANAKDTATINHILSYKKVKDLFPEDIEFCWTAKPEDQSQNLFSLIAVKKSKMRIMFNHETVEKVSVEPIQSSYMGINIELKGEKLAKEFAQMTQNNIAKSLPIMLDGEVLSYPRVQSEITGGHLTISGNFDLEEALLIKALIIGGELRCTAIQIR